MTVYEELAIQYSSALWQCRKALSTREESYWQGKKDAFRVALALLAETDADRNGWEALRESSGNMYLDRLAAMTALSADAKRLFEIDATDNEVDEWMEWFQRVHPDAQEKGE